MRILDERQNKGEEGNDETRNMNYNELKQCLQSCGFPVSGAKSVLISRLAICLQCLSTINTIDADTDFEMSETKPAATK